ncbi:ATP-binding protein [Streptomyces acidiscabies]|uniref:ATP-binding protein n=1 Tax=Streptomyces acidiscabies TaxID=42234 RepID=A0AAP6BL54_9ACTN|nr:ATP-binding protein [Streptomyces acidiscabies]MBP5936945.1 ATP-binding protein [Streptomyces sp. LBUM 1476]MBZ3915019.1 ATP-binding protein [Streptomyces acidiscabies]MDX2966821.1 ATP-binding protein [Streptomyces acidiscabies]MDX3025839.1 ATP-binding protein [Streptomyces acidiscabies]MDX3796812.1 ATP-binding protein [Streptomyces acidiscabies]
MVEHAQDAYEEFRLPLFVEPEELHWVRRVVRSHVRLWGLDAVLDDALEVVTELLTNVHRYAGGIALLVLQYYGDELRITVSDRSRVLPVVKEPDWDAQSGRGMLLVSALTEWWRAEATVGGKDVCCGLRVRGSA